MKIFRSVLILVLLSVYSYVAYLAFNPKVSNAYHDYYITQDSEISPGEIKRPMQINLSPRGSWTEDAPS